MFQIEDDMTIYITRGDIAYFTVTAENNGEKYMFQPGDVVRIKVFAKKDATNVAFQKDFPVLEVSEKVDILLTERETKIGDVISKPVDYWYEIELNPYTNPQTIIGYDEDGPKIFKLFPEGRDLRANTEVEEEDIPVIDAELSMTSQKPVENQAITAAMVRLSNEIAIERGRISKLANGEEVTDPCAAEVTDIRVGVDGKIYTSAGNAVRGQVANLDGRTATLEEKTETLEEEVQTLNAGGLNIKDAYIEEKINGWLEEHPEATTTVQNHSLTIDKMVVGTLGYITPQMFGAKADGITDDTEAFNLACLATEVYSDELTERTIFVPAGKYYIGGTVYVRKGQTLKGNGMSSTFIYTGTSMDTTTFVMAKNEDGSDPGGKPCTISDLRMDGSANFINTGGCPGFSLSNLFLTNSSKAINVCGGDGVIDNVIVDQGLNGIVIENAQNILFNNVLLYAINYQMTISDNCYDLQFNNCHFEYPKYASVVCQGSNIFNVLFNGCQFISNESYTSFLGFEYNNANNCELSYANCSFRNGGGLAIVDGSGFGHIRHFNGCEFDGRKTNPTYSQSEKMGGFNIMTSTNYIFNCIFRNLSDFAISVHSAYATNTVLKGCRFENCSKDAHISFSNTYSASRLEITDCFFDKKLMTGTMVNEGLTLKNNIGGVYSEIVTDGTNFIVPFVMGKIYKLSLVVNQLIQGNLNYRSAIVLGVSCSYTLKNGAIYKDISVNKIMGTPTNTDLDDVLDKITVTTENETDISTFMGYLKITLSTTYPVYSVEWSEL